MDSGTPGRDPGLEAAFLEASRALVAIAVRSVAQAPVELTVAQYRVLVILSTRGDHTIGDIATAIGVNPSNATRHCDRLQRLGLTARTRSTVDGRVVQVTLTDDGRGVVEVVTEHRRQQVQQVLEAMGAADRHAAVHAMEAFNRAAATLDQPSLSSGW